MTKIKALLSDTRHRPYDLPNGKWSYYQEWNKAFFLHWKIPIEILRTLVPMSFQIDTFENNAYVSLVAFTMEKIRPRGLPSVKSISDFDEINLRTYIINDHKKGVYFLNIEASKKLSAFIAKQLSGLPYEKATLKRSSSTYESENLKKGFYFNAKFEVHDTLKEKTELDLWLTERYCLYLDFKGIHYRYDIHHKAWKIKNVELKQLDLNYKIGGLTLTDLPELTHYSEGVRVVAWKKTKL